MSDVTKPAELVAAENVAATAKGRLQAAQDALYSAQSALADAEAAKREAWASDSIEPDRAAALERRIGDARAAVEYAAAARDTARERHVAALADVRPLMRQHYAARHRALMDRRNEIIREADAALDAVKAKLAEADRFRDEFHRLRAEAGSEECGGVAPDSPTALAVPAYASRAEIRVCTGREPTVSYHPNLAHALGAG